MGFLILLGFKDVFVKFYGLLQCVLQTFKVLHGNLKLVLGPRLQVDLESIQRASRNSRIEYIGSSKIPKGSCVLPFHII